MKLINTIGLLLCGLSIGWIVGLSTTPVIQGVLNSVLTIITSILTILFGFQSNNDVNIVNKKLGEINVFPVSLFLLGLAISSSFGIYARTNEWFGVNPIKFKEKWEIKDQDSTKIINRLYELKYGSIEKNSIIEVGAPHLYYVSSSICGELIKAKGNDFITLLSSLKDSKFQEFLNSEPDSIQIEYFKQKLKCE